MPGRREQRSPPDVACKHGQGGNNAWPGSWVGKRGFRSDIFGLLLRMLARACRQTALLEGLDGRQMHVRPHVIQKHAFVHLPRDADVIDITYIQVYPSQPAAQIGIPHLQGAGDAIGALFGRHFLGPGKELEVGADALSGRGAGSLWLQAIDLNVFGLLGPHALGQHHAFGAVILFLATGLEARSPQGPQRPAVLLHEVGVTLFAVELHARNLANDFPAVSGTAATAVVCAWSWYTLPHPSVLMHGAGSSE